MVDATQAKKLINPYVDWKNRPYDSSRSQEAEKREALRKAFVDFVRENGGWIVSPPGSRIAVIETVRDSPPPAKLAQLGYAI